MLETRKSVTLNGTSQIKTGENGNTIPAVTMTANISKDGNSNIITNVINHETYAANKAECRADIDAFTAEVRKLEDEEA